MGILNPAHPLTTIITRATCLSPLHSSHSGLVWVSVLVFPESLTMWIINVFTFSCYMCGTIFLDTEQIWGEGSWSIKYFSSVWLLLSKLASSSVTVTYLSLPKPLHQFSIVWNTKSAVFLLFLKSFTGKIKILSLFLSSPLPVPFVWFEFPFLGVSHLNCQHFSSFCKTQFILAHPPILTQKTLFR